MKKINQEILDRFYSEPGKLTYDEHILVKEFLEGYKVIRDQYRHAFGYDPTEFALESNLNRSDWYLNFKKDNS